MLNTKNHNLIIGSLCALGCEIFYGFSYVFTKQATNGSDPLFLLGWRFLIAFAAINICAAAGLIKIDLKGKKIKPLLLVALFSPVIYFIGETVGISRTTASESGIFLACIPVASLVMSALILRKKPSANQVVGILVTLIGVLITVFAAGLGASGAKDGYIFLLIAVISYALYSVFAEKFSQYTGWEITYVMLLSGAAVFCAAALISAVSAGDLASLARLPMGDKGFLSAILYQGIGCSVFAFFLANTAIAKIGVNRTASFIGVATVVSVFAGRFVLHEKLTIYQIAGAIVIVAGVYIANGIKMCEK